MPPHCRSAQISPQSPTMTTYRIVELLGDGISHELSQSVHTLASSLPFNLEFLPVDLSDEGAKKTDPWSMT